MALVALFDLEQHRMDIIIVFLNGDIEETFYVEDRKLCVKRPKEYGLQTNKNHFMNSSKHLVNGTITLIK